MALVRWDDSLRKSLGFIWPKHFAIGEKKFLDEFWTFYCDWWQLRPFHSVASTANSKAFSFRGQYSKQGLTLYAPRHWQSEANAVSFEVYSVRDQYSELLGLFHSNATAMSSKAFYIKECQTTALSSQAFSFYGQNNKLKWSCGKRGRTSNCFIRACCHQSILNLQNFTFFPIPTNAWWKKKQMDRAGIEPWSFSPQATLPTNGPRPNTF